MLSLKDESNKFSENETRSWKPHGRRVLLNDSRLGLKLTNYSQRLPTPFPAEPRQDRIVAHAPIIINILVGSLVGSYLGVRFATRINEHTLIRIVVIFLAMLSAILIGHDFIYQARGLPGPYFLKIILGAVAGVVIGVFSSMLGVAGGELIIPTILLLFAVDIKLAGSLSLAISIPTIILGLVKYRNVGRFTEIRPHAHFIVFMSLGSIVGALAGSYFLRYAPGSALHALLGVILLVSAVKLSVSHRARKQE